MSSVEQFAAEVAGVENLPAPFRESLTKSIADSEVVSGSLFSPAFRAGRFSTLASVLCVTNSRWLVALMQDNGSVTVDSAPYGTTLRLELTIILLYGQVRIDFVRDGQILSTALQFNTVMKDNYYEALQDILNKMGHHVGPPVASNWKGSEILRPWPIKFRNSARIYAPRDSRLLDGVQWSDIYGGFHRQLAPAAALLLTDRHLMVIAEEKPAGWFQFRERSHYGVIVTYFPLDRVATFRISKHARFDKLQVVGPEGPGCEAFEIAVPHDQVSAVTRLMEKASSKLLEKGPHPEGTEPRPIVKSAKAAV
jgi:hypothetical protein